MINHIILDSIEFLYNLLNVNIPLSINIAINRSRFCLVINDIRNPIRKPE